MPRKRVILELGTGNDLHGGDYTKAALRAVQDALHHSSLMMLRMLGVDSRSGMFVEVTIGVQQPDKVDLEAVRRSLPHGVVTAKAVKGGLDVIDREHDYNAVIANAAVAVRLELPGPVRAGGGRRRRPLGSDRLQREGQPALLVAVLIEMLLAVRQDTATDVVRD